MVRIISILFSFILLSFNIYSKKAESFVIDNQYTSNLHHCIEIYTDTTNKLTITDIINLSNEFQFPDYQYDEIFIGFSNDNQWFKFELINNNPKARTVILQIKNPLIWELELFSVINNKLEKFPKTGIRHNFKTRQINSRYYAYELQLEPNIPHLFFLRINNNSNTTNLPINLFIPSKYSQLLAKNNLAHGLIYGIIITVLISTFILWLANLKEKGIKYYIWFFAYVLFIGLFNLSIDGYAFQYIWPNQPGFNTLAIILFPAFGFYFLSRFTCDFFDLKKNNKILQNVLIVLGYLTLIPAILALLERVPSGISISMLIIFIITLNIAIIYTAISLYTKVTRLSIYFILAYIIMIIGIIVQSTYVFGIGVPLEINNIVLKSSTVGQFILLTIALNAKMRLQQDIIYQQSITTLKETKELKEKLYVELEKKVEERTRELTSTKNKIQEANQLIQNKNQDLEKAFKKSSNHYIKLQKALRTINEQKENLEKANKEIQESSRLKEIFLANTSHEIRTPLNAIVGFTNLLLKSAPTEQQLKYIKNIKASGENLLVVINDILDFSKIEAGKLTFEETNFNIFELMEHIKETFRVKAEEKNIILSNINDENIPPYLAGDPVRLNQILINLVGNAIKFTGEKGKIKFGVSLKEKLHQSVHLHFFIEDTGIGISEENIENIFESFTQAESDTTRKYGGTGLGLSIVKQLVELQRGNITVKSKLNEGTRFDFNLEYRIGKEHPTLQISQKTVEFSDCHPEGLKILIVEDNEVNQHLAIDTIKLWNNNIEIEIAQNGNIAIQKSFESKYDIILMDIQMPQMDGFETTGVIRKEKESPNNKTPIIAMTAHAMKDEKENCIAAGMNDYISKPFDPEELFAKIKTYTCKKVIALIQRGEKIDYSKVICDESDCEDYKKPTDSTSINPTSTTTFETNEFKYINLSHLYKLYKSDAVKIKKILGMYLEGIPVDLEAIKLAIEETNWDVLRTKAHSLKPKLSYIGLQMASENAKQIELLAKNMENMEEISENVRSISEIWQPAFVEIENFVKT